MKKNYGQPDYHSYHWKRDELILAVIKSVLVVCLFAYFFYRSVWAAIPLAAVGVFFFRGEQTRKKEKQGEELNRQFKECILSVAASLKAGYAVENAFLESSQDMRLLYGEDSMIYQELEGIRRGLVINITLEEQLLDLAKRSGSEEIDQFAKIFFIAKRSGGSLAEIIRTSAELIGQRMEVKSEMQTVLAGRKMEQMIMRMIPFGLVLYIEATTPGYFDSLYHNFQGIAIMTACLALYLAAYALGERVIRRIALQLS